MKRLSGSKRGWTDNYGRLGETYRLTLMLGTRRALVLLASRPMSAVRSHERWSIELSYIVKTPRVAGSSHGNGSSAPGVGNVFGKV